MDTNEKPLEPTKSFELTQTDVFVTLMAFGALLAVSQDAKYGHLKGLAHSALLVSRKFGVTVADDLLAAAPG